MVTAKKDELFERWWASLTPPEHKLIGRSNAEYVWKSAVESYSKRNASLCEQMGMQGYGTLAIAAAIREGYTAV